MPSLDCSLTFWICGTFRTHRTPFPSPQLWACYFYKLIYDSIDDSNWWENSFTLSNEKCESLIASSVKFCHAFVCVVVLVPGHAPAVTAGCYFGVDCEHRHRCIRLYWQVNVTSIIDTSVVAGHIDGHRLGSSMGWVWVGFC